MTLFNAVRVLLLAFSMIGVVNAQGNPPALTRIILPYPSGGSTDFLARAVADKLRNFVGGSVVVENRPGGNGAVAVQAVSRAPGDGSVLLVTAGSALVINPHLYKNLSYDPAADLTPISRLAISASVLAIRATIPANNLRELVAWSRGRGQPLRIGSSGVGSIGHLWEEQLKSATRLDVLHVPYKGVTPILTDMLGDQIDGTLVDIAGVAPQVTAGKVKLVGLIGAARNAAAPSVLTMDEQGFPGVDGLSWYGMLGPAKMPEESVRRVSEAVGKTLADSEIVAKFTSVGMATAFQSGPDFAKTMRSETEWWGRLIADRKIKADE